MTALCAPGSGGRTAAGGGRRADGGQRRQADGGRAAAGRADSGRRRAAGGGGRQAGLVARILDEGLVGGQLGRRDGEDGLIVREGLAGV
ncbi:MAG: hypothetical protein E7115_05685 [Bacteroidales bacterium]|nr:hypothetical protein [Bacteroidales bacterium]